MKQCPTCKGFEIYNDDEERCPFCNSVLVPYIRRNERGTVENVQEYEEPIRPTYTHHVPTREEEPVLEQHIGKNGYYRGIVVSISPSTRYISNGLKLFNSIIRGEPYQLGYPVYENVIRLEEISVSRLPDKMRNLVYYGELNELNVGDDVSVTAVERHGSLIVRNIVINDVESSIHSSRIMPAALVRMLAATIVLIVVLLITAVISFFTSGGILTLFNSLATGLANFVVNAIIAVSPILGIIFIFWLFFHRRK